MPPATSASITSPPFGDQGLAQWISRINPISAPETRYCGADRKSIAFLTNWTRNIAPPSPLALSASRGEKRPHQAERRYTGPEMPPSLRTRQKWTAMRNAAISGMPTQWRT